mmetsp:Transcript_15803/g.34207  ORF Transcript_15803/g.34207 Transcript_15803/m.34207 type:complete len:112 (-) Transcript_15803:182-517(-)
MSELKFPDFLAHEAEAKSFIVHLLAKDPNYGPRFDGIKSHPWMSNWVKLPDWVNLHALQESKARSKSTRRSSMVNLHTRAKAYLTLTLFIEDMCAQIISSAAMQKMPQPDG